MAKCPNCGREAARTSDWVCEWCGYPLPDGSFKKIGKTFRELKEERQSGAPAEEEVQAAEETESKPPQQVKPPPGPEPAPEGKPQFRREALQKIMRQSVSPPTPVVKPASQPNPPIEAKPAPPPAAKPDIVEELKPASLPEVKPEPTQAAIEITVSDLLSAYQTEGSAADARFTNRILRITGVIDKINVKAAMDIYSITLNSSGKNLLPQGVRCVFDREYASALNQLASGQTVTVQGNYTGSMIDISLRNCILVR